MPVKKSAKKVPEGLFFNQFQTLSVAGPWLIAPV